MAKTIIYIHGKGGNAEEAIHYKPLFGNCDVIGFDYESQTPWEAREEFPKFFDTVCRNAQPVEIIANSIGAFFSMNALTDKKISKAYFISPVVDMKKLISDMMLWANVTEEELKCRKNIPTAFGETLSWEYLCYVKEHPVAWNVPPREPVPGASNARYRGNVDFFSAQRKRYSYPEAPSIQFPDCRYRLIRRFDQV